MSFSKIKSGFWAHIGRRLFHMFSISLTPFIYYELLKPAFPEVFFSEYLVITICFIVLAFEAVRLGNGWVLYGQRPYEARRISALAWTTFSLTLLLIFSPDKNLTYALAISCALADPLLGELRARAVDQRSAFTLSMVLIFAVWQLLGFGWVVSILMGVLTTVVEQPKLPWLDDNALMLLIPFGFYGVLHVWFLA